MSVFVFILFIIFSFVAYGLLNKSPRAQAKKNRKYLNKLFDQLTDDQVCELIGMLEED